MQILKNAFIMMSFLSMSWSYRHECEHAIDYSNDMLVEIDHLDKRLLKRLMSCELLDQWSLNPLEKSAVFRVHADDLKKVKRMLRGTKSSLEISSTTIQELIDNERSSIMEKTGSADWFDSYHSVEEIRGFFDGLAEENPSMVQMVDEIGRSYEGRSIFAVHLNAPKAEKSDEGDEEPRPRCAKKNPNKIWIQCLIHAREWISGSTCQYIAQELVNGYRTGDQAIKKILDQNEVIMIPIVNPDGYAHTWQKDRLWRKNRHPFRFGTGVDLNRNFAEEHWCKVGASNVPFADTYCGPAAGSEPETKTIMAYYQKYAGRVAAAVDVHSFSQLILRPSGFSEVPSVDEAALLTASELMADAIESTHGKSYVSIRASQLYPTTGSATDYFYSMPNQAFRPYSIALELRPGRKNALQGFLLDPAEIKPCVEEVMAGFMAFTRYAIDNPITAEN